MNFRSNTLYHNVLKDLTLHTPVNNTQSFAMDQLSRSVVRKYNEAEVTSVNSETFQAAIAKFHAINMGIEDYKFDLANEAVAMAITYGRETLLGFFPQNSFYEPNCQNGKFGPGGSFGVPSTAMYSKLADKLTYSSAGALRFFLEAAEGFNLPSGFYIPKIGKEILPVVTSKLWTVPKNDEIDRCICIEPSLNMFLQQAIKFDLEKMCERLGCKIDTQSDVQRKLARRGSLDDSLSTLDLTSASDTISLSFCEHYLPKDLLHWLKVARTAFTVDPIDGKEVELKMIGTMGNATTFPLQTLIFLSLCMGVYRVLGIKPVPRRTAQMRQNIGVFGDDIIIDTRAYDLVTQVLRTCGFIPNMEKSFKSGLFKESCGGDYYGGTDVRGVYVKSLKKASGIYSAYNRLVRWSRRHDVPLHNTLNGLYTSIRNRPLHVPIWCPDTSGFHDKYVQGRFKMLVSVPLTMDRLTYDPLIVSMLVAGGFVSTCTDDLLQIPVRGVKWKVRSSTCFSGDNVVEPTLISQINGYFGLGIPDAKAYRELGMPYG